MSYLNIIIHLISMSRILRFSRDITRAINSRICRSEGLIESMQLASGTLPARTHTGGYFFHVRGRKLHTRGERSDELYVRTHTKVPMDDQAAYSTRMRA